MKMSLTKFRGEMFKILPQLRNNDELTLTFDGKDAYVVRRANYNRKLKFQSALEHCPSLNISDETLLSFIKEGQE